MSNKHSTTKVSSKTTYIHDITCLPEPNILHSGMTLDLDKINENFEKHN